MNAIKTKYKNILFKSRLEANMAIKGDNEEE